MANTIVEIDFPEALEPDTIFLQTTDPSQEEADSDGYTPINPSGWLYRIIVPEACIGIYRVVAERNSTVVGIGYVSLRDDTDTYRVISDYPVDEQALNDIYAKLIALGSITAFRGQPVMKGKIQAIVIGDSYLIANGNALSWTTAPVPGFVLANTSARFGLKNIKTGNCLVVDNQSVTLVDDEWLVQIELTHEQTSLLPEGSYAWSVELLYSTSEITIDRSSNYRVYTPVIPKYSECEGA